MGGEPIRPGPEDLFARFLDGLDQGKEIDFEQFLLIHPDSTEELRALHVAWKRFQSDEIPAPGTVRILDEDRALPLDGPSRAADRRSHARFDELRRLERQLGAARRSQALRLGQRELEQATLPPALEGADLLTLVSFARRRVDPEFSRRLFGEERLGLVVAGAALERSDGGDETVSRAKVLDLLAWAHLANGEDDLAVARARDALLSAHDHERELCRQAVERLERAVQSSRGASVEKRLRELDQTVAELNVEVSRRSTYRFELESERFLFETLQSLGEKIELFLANEGESVRRRLVWGQKILQLTLNHPKASESWDDARWAIAEADDVVASGRYGEYPVDLAPQTGLVPIGMNPVTRLWEFYHLRSAYDPNLEQEPASLEIPRHQDDGSLVVTEASGIVFVLIPGGRFFMGAQRSDPEERNYDQNADSDESPVRSVALAPFFLSRYELTQGQWLRLAGTSPSFFGPHFYRTEWNSEGREADRTFPVEQISWEDCSRQLGLYGLLLPTEAQWEYAARAGSETPWWCGSDLESLSECCNLADAYGKSHGARWSQWEEELNDGSAVQTRVGSYRFNAFGLHDTIGNLLEWCRDEYGSYELNPRQGDGARFFGKNGARPLRGGSFSTGARPARSSARHQNWAGFQGDMIGCRPARSLFTQ